MKIIYYALCVLFFINLNESARILGVFPLAGKSLNRLYNRLMKGLTDAGHDVTVISSRKNSLPILNGSYTDIELTGFVEAQDEMIRSLNFLERPVRPTIFNINHEPSLAHVWNKTLVHPNVKKLFNSSQKFDAIIVAWYHNECLNVLSQLYNAPLISFVTLGGIHPAINNIVGNILPPSYAPHYSLLTYDFSKERFIDRAYNTLFYIRDYLMRYFITFPTYNRLLKSIFNNPPDMWSFYNNISLVLFDSYITLHPALPTVPNIIDIGGFHIDQPKKLPEEFQKILDEAKNGVIYFSMGTYLRSKDFTPEKKQIFLNVFRKLNQTILWKFEDEVLVGKPDNVLIRKWLPQNDILAHPNLKLFISHCGHASAQETLYHGVPVLAIPIATDQFTLASMAVDSGYALKLSYKDNNFTEENLMNAIKELLENPVYKNNAKLRSKIFRDRPMKPLDTAVYWIEYVIRHKGADHLRVPGYNMPWYQLYLVDVILCFTVIGFLVIGCLVIILKSLSGRGKSPKKSKKQ